MISSLLSYVQLDSCWLLPRSMCHYCTHRAFMPCWSLSHTTFRTSLQHQLENLTRVSVRIMLNGSNNLLSHDHGRSPWLGLRVGFFFFHYFSYHFFNIYRSCIYFVNFIYKYFGAIQKHLLILKFQTLLLAYRTQLTFSHWPCTFGITENTKSSEIFLGDSWGFSEKSHNLQTEAVLFLLL